MSGSNPRRWIATTAALAVVVTVVGLSCDDNKPAPAAPESPNVLLILIDTLRADKLGCYGSDLGLTPNIDAFARSGVRFDRAFSHAPWTLPSVASLLTSTPPMTHGAGRQQRGKGLRFTKLGPSVRTLPECLGDQGYRTAAIVNVFFLSPKFGMDRGFDKYDFVRPVINQGERRAKRVTDLAVEWIGENRDGERPFFLLAHYFDPHLTYDPPKEFRRKYAGPKDRETGPLLFGTEGDMVGFRRGRININDIPVKRLEKLYNGEIASADREVGRLLDEIRNMGLDESTIVVLTADHGEEFLDHGGFEHGHTLYDELLHVPLVFRFPNAIQPGTVNATVGQIDVAPTICELAGVLTEDTFTGRSLFPLMTGETKKDRAILSQGNMWGPIRTSWRHGGYKLIKDSGGVELYDVSEDRREQRDLGAHYSQAMRRKRMLEDMALVLKSAGSLSAGESSGVSLSSQEKDRLKALGYVADEEESEGGAPDSATSQPTTQPVLSDVG